MLIYIAGPYRAETHDEVAGNIRNAKALAADCYRKGHNVLCPHMNTAFMDREEGLDSDEFWLGKTLDLLRRCDAIVLVDGYEKSAGTAAEIKYARSVGIPVYTSDKIPELSEVEIRRPLQVNGFIEVIMQMYRLHLTKNMDYSLANVLATGHLGVVVRLWDKIARLMNLSGWRIEIADSSFQPPRDPKHESIEDTLIDAANYAVIALLLKAKKWGR